MATAPALGSAGCSGSYTTLRALHRPIGKKLCPFGPNFGAAADWFLGRPTTRPQPWPGPAPRKTLRRGGAPRS